LLPASFGYLSCELYWLLYMSKTSSRYGLASGSVQLDSPSALRGEGDDVVVKIVFLAPIDACRLMGARAIVSHLDCSALKSELISIQ